MKPKELEAIKDKKFDDNKKILKYKDTFNELSNERISEIYNMSKQTDFDNLNHYFKDQNITTISFISFKGSLHIYNFIKDSNISIEKIEEDQKQFKSKLNEITTGDPKYKSKDQLDTIENIKNLYFITKEKIKLYNQIIIIILLKLYLKLCIKQKREQDLKYYLLDICIKDYQ